MRQYERKTREASGTSLDRSTSGSNVGVSKQGHMARLHTPAYTHVQLEYPTGADQASGQALGSV